MGNEIELMRTLHIGFGLTWVCLAFLVGLALVPRLRALSTGFQRPVARVVTLALGTLIGISAVFTILVGVAMAFRMTGGHLSVFVSTSWGLAIAVGFVASIAGIIAWLMTWTTANRAVVVGSSMGGTRPTTVQASQVRGWNGQLAILVLFTAVLPLIALAAMTYTRFV